MKKKKNNKIIYLNKSIFFHYKLKKGKKSEFNLIFF